MTVQRYKLHRISTLSLAKFGCVLGGLAMVLPGLICGLVSVQVVAGLHTLLGSWQSAQVDLVDVPVEFDFITLLGLETIQTVITRLADQQIVLVLLVLLLSVLGGGLLVALIILLVGWGYNLLAVLTGGLEVELRT